MKTGRLTSLRRTPISIFVSAALVAGFTATSAVATTSATTGAITSVTTRNGLLTIGVDTAGSGSVLPVTSCADDGSPGTLREVVIGASSGDTVDLTQLTCGSITLSTGQVQILVNDLTIEGPGASALTIDGNYGSSNATTSIGRVFFHHGTGTLTINGLTIANGLYNNPGFAFAFGGCISSSGGVALNHSTVTGCRVISGHQAWGGGISAEYQVTVNQSTVSNNQALVTGYQSYLVSGGGIHAQNGPLVITNSLITNNKSEVSYMQGNHNGISQAKAGGASCYNGLVTITGSVVSGNFAGCDTTSTSCYQAFAGGIAAENGLTMSLSTVSNNTAEANDAFSVSGGGIYTGGGPAAITNSTISYNNAKRGGGILIANAYTATISASTINNNSAAYVGGGIWVAEGALTVVNTTISGNAASGRTTGIGGAIYISNNGFASPMELDSSTVAFNYSSGPLGGGGIVDENRVGPSNFQSSIIANNTVRVSPATYDADLGVALGAVDGANNLIIAASGVTLPPGTLNVDPMLGPLQDNGGPTWTQALLAGSPAIAAGNNLAGLPYDQRGPGYVRSFSGVTDIGAFEVQPPDEIFKDGFDGP
jgi:hypothetical protein